MDDLPDSYGIRRMCTEELSNSGQKPLEFLSGWMGGPWLHIENYGHRMLRRRHLNFKIGNAERDQWLMCVKLAQEEVVADTTLRCELYAAIFKLADHMRNRPEQTGEQERSDRRI